MFSRLAKTKTFWTGLAGICTVVGAYFAGEVTLMTMLLTVFGALLATFLRDGIAKPPTP